LKAGRSWKLSEYPEPPLQSVTLKVCQTSGSYYMSHFEEKLPYQHMPDYQPLHHCNH